MTIEGASGLGLVSHADSVAVSLTMGPATVAMAQGWPAAGITASAPLKAQLSVPFAAAADGIGVATIADRTYGIVVAGGTIDGSTLSLDEGGTAALFSVPTGIDPVTFAHALGAASPSVAVSWDVSGDAATTTVTYGDNPTVVVVPAARAKGAGLKCDLGTFATIDGPYAACEAKAVSWDVPMRLALRFAVARRHHGRRA